MLKVFSIYDSKAEAHLQPFFAPTRGMAIRSFQTAANSAGHDFNRFAADYTLFELGEFEPSSGNFNLHERHQNLGLAAEFITIPGGN